MRLVDMSALEDRRPDHCFIYWRLPDPHYLCASFFVISIVWYGMVWYVPPYHIIILRPSLITMTSPEPPYRIVSLATSGGIANNDSPKILLHNTELLTDLLQTQDRQTIVIDGVFHLWHGVRVVDQSHLHLQFQPGAALRFHRDYENPQRFRNSTVDQGGRPPACLAFHRVQNLTLTGDASLTSLRGLLHGGGSAWWGWPYVGYAQVLEHRPYLLLFNHSTDVTLAHMVLQDSPFYHVQITDSRRVQVHHTSIVSRRTRQLTHSAWDLSAFNTDGIDIAGHDVHVHDLDIWLQDDCIAVKDNLWSTDIDRETNGRLSSNMLFERITASGLGLTIGSISGTTVQNITFRDSILYRTYKGIYAKFRAPSNPHSHPHNSLIQNILYENITMIEPLQYAIWLGPAQQNGGHTSNPCHAAPCSLCWPHIPGATCDVVPNARYRNITLRNIDIVNAKG